MAKSVECVQFSAVLPRLVIHVEINLTHGLELNIVADRAHHLMPMVFPSEFGLFQQDNAPSQTAHTVQERFEEHDKEFKVLSWPPNSPDR